MSGTRSIVCEPVAMEKQSSETLIQPADIQQGYSLFHSDVAKVNLPNTVAFALTGDDRKGWLQGQITNDMRDLLPGGRLSACLCTPTGQLTAIVDVFDGPDALYIVTTQPEILEQRVRDYVILEEVELTRLSESIPTLQGVKTSKALSQIVDLPPTDVAISADFILLRNDRTGTGGWDVIKGADKLPPTPEAPVEALRLASLEAGYPLFGVDTDSKTLPPELGKAFEKRTISYKKGCYQGQEIIHRIHARGHTNRSWVGLLCDSPVIEGQEVLLRNEPVGTILRAGETEINGAIASAMLKNSASREGTIVTVNGVTAEVVEMPILRFD